MFDWLFKGRHDCRSSYGIQTKVCRHLMTGTRLGWHARRDSNDLDATWPDAWCSACNDLLRIGGDSAGHAGVPFVAVCDGCYERYRGKNWPAGSQGRVAELVARARPKLDRLNREARVQYGLDELDWFDWEPDTHRLLLKSRKTGRGLAATIQLVGSYSGRSETWLWSWGDTRLAEKERSRLRSIRAHGEENAMLKLAAPHWPASEQDAWDMTAIASDFIECKGSYRTPNPNGHIYMLLLDVETS